MELEIRICPYVMGMGSPNTDPYHKMRITLKFRGKIYQKEEINRLPELHSTMDYLFEAARREMKAMIVTYMLTGSPVEGLVQNYLEVDHAGL